MRKLEKVAFDQMNCTSHCGHVGLIAPRSFYLPTYLRTALGLLVIQFHFLRRDRRIRGHIPDLDLKPALTGIMHGRGWVTHITLPKQMFYMQIPVRQHQSELEVRIMMQASSFFM